MIRFCPNSLSFATIHDFGISDKQKGDAIEKLREKLAKLDEFDYGPRITPEDVTLQF